MIPAIAAGSKTGHLFILNRETGKPIFGVEERPVPLEWIGVTQPFQASDVAEMDRELALPGPTS